MNDQQIRNNIALYRADEMLAAGRRLGLNAEKIKHIVPNNDRLHMELASIQAKELYKELVNRFGNRSAPPPGYPAHQQAPPPGYPAQQQQQQLPPPGYPAQQNFQLGGKRRQTRKATKPKSRVPKKNKNKK